MSVGQGGGGQGLALQSMETEDLNEARVVYRAGTATISTHMACWGQQCSAGKVP